VPPRRCSSAGPYGRRSRPRTVPSPRAGPVRARSSPAGRGGRARCRVRVRRATPARSRPASTVGRVDFAGGAVRGGHTVEDAAARERLRLAGGVADQEPAVAGDGVRWTDGNQARAAVFDVDAVVGDEFVEQCRDVRAGRGREAVLDAALAAGMRHAKNSGTVRWTSTKSSWSGSGSKASAPWRNSPGSGRSSASRTRERGPSLPRPSSPPRRTSHRGPGR